MIIREKNGIRILCGFLLVLQMQILIFPQHRYYETERNLHFLQLVGTVKLRPEIMFILLAKEGYQISLKVYNLCKSN